MKIYTIALTVIILGCSVDALCMRTPLPPQCAAVQAERGPRGTSSPVVETSSPPPHPTPSPFFQKFLDDLYGMIPVVIVFVTCTYLFASPRREPVLPAIF